MILFVGREFSREGDIKSHFKFHTKKVVPLVYRIMPRMGILVDELPTSGPLELVAVFGLCVGFTDTYNIVIHQVWYR